MKSAESGGERERWPRGNRPAARERWDRELCVTAAIKKTKLCEFFSLSLAFPSPT